MKQQWEHMENLSSKLKIYWGIRIKLFKTVLKSATGEFLLIKTRL